MAAGVKHIRVLCPRGYEDTVHVIGGESKLHVTLSLTINASGDCTGVRVIHEGKQNRANKLLSEICQGLLTGQWKFSVSTRGYMERRNFLEVAEDLDEHLTRSEVPRPVVLFIDGYR